MLWSLLRTGSSKKTTAMYNIKAVLFGIARRFGMDRMRVVFSEMIIGQGEGLGGSRLIAGR